MKLKFLALLLIFSAIIVTACASTVVEQPVLAQSAPVEGQPGQSAAAVAPAWEQNVRVDEQGAVVVEVTPLNLNTQGDTLDFEIALNTHSVDLGMDLAQLATLTTDAGLTINATSWDAPRGGHHASGKLIFPSKIDGKSILDGATNITVQIRDVDASLRTFVWRVQ